ncbi:ATP-dependent RNA helicase RhlE [Rhizobium leucaenae]|uniref:ATP-dependent RNA helicase RhlE n=1 Tax=Rhizobium leucaenae TaxID=29450 RepID=A0A7W6ZPE1_9HYPH|nr:DEAD/DEAH box helicase [Rhizobium leucaenae]MBB4566105.1 ATP-dependent RNA helicase RhlE [Rhizobium leucaenae]MBB6302268.1 ATP-dependent RNA helicase RhlE [Rhizobium leucaenae]
MTDFHSLGLSKQIVDTLSQNNFATPTPIQAQAIPLVLQGRDLIGLAQTGTGKTAAFGLPIIEMLLKDAKRPDNRTVRTLILAPTRELVNQIADNLKLFVRKTPLRINVVVGGASINKQQLQLERGTDILVATPGRLLDLINRRALSLGYVNYLVLDEADQMLDLGFIHDLRKIAKLVPAKRQTLLFSATMPKAIADLASDYLTNPLKVEVSPPGKAADKVEQYVHFVAGQNHKTEILKETISANPDGRAIVFLRTKHGAEKLMKHLDHVGFAAASIHGNKSQGQRERALKGFRDGEVRVLVATDVAARGIDIPGVSHVYNYDLPEVPDAYVHRIGRTARAGRDGIAIAFCAPDEIRLLRDIERLMGIEIAVASGEAPADRARPARGNSRGGRGNQGRGGAGQGRPEGRSGRPGGRPQRDGEQGEARARTGERQERRPRDDRPQRENNRNADFRGQRRDERTPRPEADNDLVSTSDFRPAKKPHHNGQANAAAAHEAGAHRGPRHAHGRPSGRHNEERGQGHAHGEHREGGNGGMKRRGPRNGNGQRRERA